MQSSRNGGRGARVARDKAPAARAGKAPTARARRESGGSPPGRARWVRVAKWAALGGLVVAALGALAVAITFWVLSRDLPSTDEARRHRFPQVTRILAVAGDGREQVVGELYKERRTTAPFSAFPPLLVDAFVVAEDAGFWTHGGIDYRGMLRAFFVNLTSGTARQGASTITQQVVKNLILTPEKTFRRKMQEIMLARRLENELTKQEILTLYLNQIYFGQGRYGVVEAARYYFGKELAQLQVHELAYLAGLPQAPEAISRDEARGVARRRYVVDQLLAHGKIDQATADAAANAPPPRPARNPAPIAEVRELVRRELVEEHGEAALDTLGADVRVTVRPELQRAAREALRARLRQYDEKFKVGRPVRRVAPAAIPKEVRRLARQLDGGEPPRGKVLDAVVTGVFDADAELEVDLGGWTAAVPLDADDQDRFDPVAAGAAHRPASKRFAVGDVVEVVVPRRTDLEVARGGGRVARLAPGPEGAVVVIDVASREVLALVGGFDVRPGEFNRAVDARRQPGSTFKPFVYAAAIASRQLTPASIVNDAPDVYDQYRPKNYSSTFEGPVRLRTALARSINTVAIRVCHQLGPAAVASLAHAMGIESDLPEQLSLSLGAGEVTPLELTNAFATFAAGGIHRPVRLVDAVDGALRPAGPPTQALAPDVAFVVTDLMRSVMTEGTGNSPRHRAKVTVAGKTGTSNDERDAWFVGLTPQYAIGVWVGHDDNRPLGPKQTGGALALPVFVDTLAALGPRAREFARPPGVVEARVDRATGLLAPPGADDASSYVEVFLAGTAPTETALVAGEVDTQTFVGSEYDDPPPPAPDAEETEPEEPAPAAPAAAPP